MFGPIRHYDRNYLFLWNKDFFQSNGIFVESCRNIEIMGADFVKGAASGQSIASQNRIIRDPLVGKIVVITSGNYKGHRGRVCFGNDKTVTVELSTICKKIPVDKSMVKELNPEEKTKSQNDYGGRSFYGEGNRSMYGGATVYDGGKTPMVNPNTPNYYPQSQWGGAAINDFGGDQDNDYRARGQGSAHFSQ